MARSRDDDDDDRISNNPRAGKRRDDDDDPPPRRRSRDDDDDDGPRIRKRSGGEMGPLDGMYRDTNIVILVIFGLCCGLISLVMSLIALVTAKDPKAKSNAMTCLIVGIVSQVLGGIAYVILMAMQK